MMAVVRIHSPAPICRSRLREAGGGTIERWRNRQVVRYCMSVMGAGNDMKQRIKNHRVGEVSSKYGLRPDLFESDIKARADRAEKLWENFMVFVRENEATPEEIRTLFSRFYDKYLV